MIEIKPDFKFTLISELGTVKCDNAPEEWEDMTIELNRDMVWAGVFQDFVFEQVTFTGSREKTLLMNLKNTRGINADCVLRTERYDESIFDYVAYSGDYILNFKDLKEVLLDKTRNGIRLKTKKIGFLEKIENNKKKNVDLLKTVALDGFQIQELFHWNPLKKDCNVAATSINRLASFDNDDDSEITIDNSTTNFTIPVTSQRTDFNSATDVLLAQDVTLDKNRAFFKEFTDDRTMDVTEITVVVNFGAGAATPGILEFFFALVDTDGTTLLGTESMGTLTFTASTTKSINFTKNIAVLQDQSMIIWGVPDIISGSYAFGFGANVITATSVEISAPAGTFQGLPIYEAVERCLQLITGEQFPLKSDFLGRVDVAKNAAGDLYASENQLTFAHFINGLSARGENNSTNTLVANFSDLIESIDARMNIGIQYEKIDGVNKIVLEERADFFDASAGMDLSDKIEDIEIQYETLSEYAYSEVKSGYKKFVYEEIGGRGEYNTNNERTSVLNIDETFDNISPYRGDVFQFILSLASPVKPNGQNIVVGSKDVKGDKDIFIMKTQRFSSRWKMETNENRTVLDDTSPYGVSSFNLPWTPTLMLQPHYYQIAAGLEFEQSTFLRFQASDKASNLKTEDTGGGNEITENQNILASDLGAALWKPGQFMIKEIEFSHADWDELVAKKNKVVTLSDTKEGWILKPARYKPAKKTLEINILEKV